MKEKLIGLHIDEAEKLLENSIWRIVRIDSEDYIVTMDLHANRFNLSLDNDIVTEVKMY